MKHVYAIVLLFCAQSVLAMELKSVLGSRITTDTKTYAERRVCVISPDGATVAIKANGAGGTLLNIIDRKEESLQSASLLITGISTVALGDAATLYVGNNNQKITRYKKENGLWLRGGIVDNKESVTCLSVDPFCRLCCTSAKNGAINIWRTRELFGGVSLVGHPNATVVALEWKDNGQYVYSAGTDGGVALWDVENASAVFAFINNAVNVCSAISPVTSLSVDGPNCVLSGHQNGMAYLWDSRTAKKEREMKSLVEKPLISVHACGDNLHAFHSIDSAKNISIIEFWKSGQFLDAFKSSDQSVAYIYDKANKKLVCASGNNQLTTLDVHAIETMK